MEMRREQNVYNGNRFQPVKQTTSYHSRTSANWHMFRNYKKNLSFSDSFSFRKSPRKKTKTDESVDSRLRNSPFSFSNSCQEAKENVDSCTLLKSNPKEADCQDLIFDKENDDLIFEGLTAVMKEAILDNPKVLEFITKVLPTYPGLATIMLPNQVIALYGSWSVIKQARQQLLNLSGLHDQDVSEPIQKENKSSNLIKDGTPPILKPQKINPQPNNAPDVMNPSKSSSPKDSAISSSSYAVTTTTSINTTTAAADSSSSRISKKREEKINNVNRLNSSDSDFSLPSPSPVADSAEELDLSAVVFHTTPLKSVTSTTSTFTSAVNGNVDSDTDSENVSTTLTQVTLRTKRPYPVVKSLSKLEKEENKPQVDQLDKRKTKSKTVHVIKKQKGLSTWNGKRIKGRSQKDPSKLQNSNRANRLIKAPAGSITAKRQDSGGGTEKTAEEEGADGDTDEENDDDWTTCAATSCALKDRRDVTDIVWLQCEGCDTWWHCLCAQLGDLTEDEASSLDFTCSFCSTPKTRQSAKRNKVS